MEDGWEGREGKTCSVANITLVMLSLSTNKGIKNQKILIEKKYSVFFFNSVVLIRINSSNLMVLEESK